jgi:hypothetical protein
LEHDDSLKSTQLSVERCFSHPAGKAVCSDDVKGNRIEETLSNYYRQEISDEIDARLKKQYGVKIFENVLSEEIASK